LFLVHFNQKVPRSSIDYLNVGRKINPDSFKVGDVIVFTGTKAKNKRPGHVGIIISNCGNELLFIHSSSNKKTLALKFQILKIRHIMRKDF